jgi:multidrug efflux pump subunit AcrA (membrane-fusion protein)
MGMSGRTRRAIWVAIAMVAAIAVVAVVVVSRDHPSGATTASTAVVRRGTVTATISAAGTVTPTQTRGLAFSTSGTVSELHVATGATVTKGDVLARIDATDATDDLDAARSRLEDARDALERAESASTGTTCPTPGATRGATPPATRSTSPTTSAPDCTQTNRSSTSDSILSAQQQVNNAELSVRLAQRRLTGTTITAPIGGRVLSVGGGVGTKVQPGGTGYIVLGDVGGLRLEAEFSEADVGRRAVGQEASITLPDHNDPVAGIVSQIDPAGTVSDRLVRYGALIAFDTVPAAVLLGQSATVTVTTASVADVLYVPTAAITMSSATGTATVTVRIGGREHVRAVQVGLLAEPYTEVTSGLVEGDEVVWGGG